MSMISDDDVRGLARLSNLQLSDDEVSALRVDLGNILSYVEQLSSLDTSGVEPTYQVTGLENRWREDTVKHSEVTREALLALAPDSEDYQVKIPKVLGS